MWQSRLAGAVRSAAARAGQPQSMRAAAAAVAHSHAALAVRRALCAPVAARSLAAPRCACRSFSSSSSPPLPPPVSVADYTSSDHASVLADAVSSLAPQVDEFMSSADSSTSTVAAKQHAHATRHASQADQAAAALALQRRAVQTLSDSLKSTDDQPGAYDLSSALSPAPCHPSSLFSLALFNQLKSDIHSGSAFVKMCVRASVAPPSSASHRTWEVVPEWDFNDALESVPTNKHAHYRLFQAALQTNARVQEESVQRANDAAREQGLEPPPVSDAAELEGFMKQDPFNKQQILANLPDFFLSPALHQCTAVLDAVKQTQRAFIARQLEIEQERLQSQANTPSLAHSSSPANHRQMKARKASLVATWVPRSPALMVALVDAFIAFMNEPVDAASTSASGSDEDAPQSEEDMLADFGSGRPAPTVRNELLKMRSGRLRFDPTLAQLANFSAPHEWFPLARKMARKFIVHVGPTNSGKTYHAMQRLKHAKSGVYLGPLRLLACEVRDKLNREGVPCTLLTGQEKEIVPDALHISGTVEMSNMNTIVDVAVIDEAQMLASPDRGWAWTRALLGLPAYEVHVCGDPSMVEIVEELCAITGEPVEIREYQRLTPLDVTPPLLNGVCDVRKGDCVVAFGRQRLYDLKRAIEKFLALKVCIIYGSLPPEVRRQQAELFNDPNSGYDVLVASDAIGMGLNLNIQRVIFATMTKYDGTVNRVLTPSEARQIAGRAGRFNTGDQSKAAGVSTMEDAALSNRGECTTLMPDEHPYLEWAMKQSLASIERVGLAPTFEQLAELHTLRPKETLVNLLTYFGRYAQLDSLYFTTNMENMKAIAAAIESIPFTCMQDRYNFCLAPAKMDVDPVGRAMKVYASLFARGQKVPANAIKLDNLKHANQEINLSMMEAFYSVLDLYVWLGLKFADSGQFCDVDKTTEIRNTVGRIVQRGLGDITPSDAYLAQRRTQLARLSAAELKRDIQALTPAERKGQRPATTPSNKFQPKPFHKKAQAGGTLSPPQQQPQQQQPQHEGESIQIKPAAKNQLKLVRAEMRRVTADEQRAATHVERNNFSGLRKDRPFEPKRKQQQKPHWKNKRPNQPRNEQQQPSAAHTTQQEKA